MTKLILISGYKRSGKDTSADHVVKTYGYTKVSLAKILKDHVAKEYGIARHALDDQLLKEQPLVKYKIKNKDKFSRYIHKFLFKEYVKIDGSKSLANSFAESRKLGEVLYHTPRSICILEGSVKRSVDINHWLKLVVKKIQKHDRVVISDIRFRSELNYLKKLFKASHIRIERTSPEEAGNDPTERDLDSVNPDFLVKNKKDIKHLKDSLDYIVQNNNLW